MSCETFVVFINDLFFSALGFFLGVWFYDFYCTRKKDRGLRD